MIRTILETTDIKNHALDAIGNTPLVRLQKLVPADSAQVLVKLEYTNPTGSYKDRMALAMIEEAEKRGDLKPGMTVVEYTGGSTGSSLAFVCAVKGYPFKVVSSNAFSREKLQTMKAFGADLVIVHSDSGVTTPDLIPKRILRACHSSGSYIAFAEPRHRTSLRRGPRVSETRFEYRRRTLRSDHLAEIRQGRSDRDS